MTQQMSELKATSSGEIRARDSLLGYWWYEKSEADKVIAEKDAEILALDAEVFKQKHHARLFFDERNYAESQVRRQMYKRCLAMAKWCEYFANYWECCEPPDCGAFIARAKFNRKWLKRWLELAEKFKEAK